MTAERQGEDSPLRPWEVQVGGFRLDLLNRHLDTQNGSYHLTAGETLLVSTLMLAGGELVPRNASTAKTIWDIRNVLSSEDANRICAGNHGYYFDIPDSVDQDIVLINDRILYGPLSLQPNRRLLKTADNEAFLGPHEVTSLKLLMLRGGDFVSHRKFIERSVAKNPEALRTHVYRVNGRLKLLASDPSISIEATAGFGYHLEPKFEPVIKRGEEENPDNH